ncbi:hypothetical protein, partial [Lentzea terrae]|uniref:hypothetical protein n=1 Tax=Lentzea terrae TaxID=2200761 RepID=UPI001E471D89
VPLLTCYKDARIHCAVLKERTVIISSVLLAYLAEAGGSSAEMIRSAERHKKRVLSGPNSVPIRSLSPHDTFPRSEEQYSLS